MNSTTMTRKGNSATTPSLPNVRGANAVITIAILLFSILLKPQQLYLVTVEKGDVVSDQLDPVGEQGGVGVVHHAYDHHDHDDEEGEEEDDDGGVRNNHNSNQGGGDAKKLHILRPI